MKGGYQIVDLNKTALTAGTESTIAGVYEHLEGNFGKAVMLTGLVIGATEYPAAFITPVLSGTSFLFNVYGYDFVVADDDGVTATAAAIVAVSGTNDGTNWTKIKIGGTEKSIPSGS